jgi:hypothetical protein
MRGAVSTWSIIATTCDETWKQSPGFIHEGQLSESLQNHHITWSEFTTKYMHNGHDCFDDHHNISSTVTKIKG